MSLETGKMAPLHAYMGTWSSRPDMARTSGNGTTISGARGGLP